MPTNSPWTSATEDPADFADLLQDAMSAEFGSPILDPITGLLTTTEQHPADFSVAIYLGARGLPSIADEVNNDDWLGDDEYDDDGQLLPALPASLGRHLDPQGRGRGGGFQQKLHPRNVRAQERRTRALELRIEGKSLQVIRDLLKFNSVSGVRRTLETALATVKPLAEEMRDIELARLDAITDQLWGMIQLGDIEAIDKYLKLSTTRLKWALAGTPKRVEHQITGPDGQPIEIHEGQQVAVVNDVNEFLALVAGINSQPKAMGSENVIDLPDTDVTEA